MSRMSKAAANKDRTRKTKARAARPKTAGPAHTEPASKAVPAPAKPPGQSEIITDRRAEFWKEHFELAKDYETYLTGSDAEHARRWHDQEARLPAMSDQQVRRLVGYGRKLNVLFYSGAWCGDCVRQGPMLRRIGEVAGANVTLRFIDREVSPALQEELRILGGRRVPVVVFLSEDFFEVGRFGDRLLSAYRAKVITNTGGACDTGLVPAPGHQLEAEMEDWVAVFERMFLMLRLSSFLRNRYGD